MFVGRKTELEFLNNAYEKGTFQLIPIYGRRRVGKTDLILQFIRDKKAIYFLATSGTKNDNIEKFKGAAKKMADLSFIKNDWEDIFEYIAKNTKEKLIIAIDEFPYLIESEQGTASVFQKIADLYLKDSNIFLILSGSSISIMWKEVLAYKAPLYGRRTGQIELKQFKFAEVMEFTGKNFEETMRIYAVCGGVPAYLKEFSEKKEFFELTKEKLLSRNAVLNEEVLFLLRQEFREPRTYMSILSALSLGLSSLGKIISYCGFKDKAGIAPYLHNLEAVEYIRREVPITDSLRSKKGVYTIRDKFFNFWFRFIRTNESVIEENSEEALKIIQKDFEQYMSKIFEEVCKEALHNIMPHEFTKIGKWWESTKEGAEEIDIVALNDQTKEALFCECKWTNAKMKLQQLLELKAKAGHVKWNNAERKETFALFSKNGFEKKLEDYAKENQIRLYGLKELEKALTGKNST